MKLAIKKIAKRLIDRRGRGKIDEFNRVDWEKKRNENDKLACSAHRTDRDRFILFYEFQSS